MSRKQKRRKTDRKRSGSELQALANDHEHLAIDADHVRRMLFTPPEAQPGRLDGQVSTESDRR